MPRLTLKADHSGKLLLNLYVGVGVAKAEILGGRGLPIPVGRPLLALIDTGASRTVVEETYLEHLGLSPLSEVDVHTASTGTVPLRLNVYAVGLCLAEAVTGTLAKNLPVLAAADLSGLGVQMRLGRDVLGRVVLVCNGPAREFSVEFFEETGDA